MKELSRGRPIATLSRILKPRLVRVLNLNFETVTRALEAHFDSRRAVGKNLYCACA
jgi:hypothetical protein